MMSITIFLKKISKIIFLLVLILLMRQFSFALSNNIELRFVNESGNETNIAYRNFFCKYQILTNENIDFDSLTFIHQNELLVDYYSTDKSLLVFTKNNKCIIKFKYKGKYAEKVLFVKDVDFGIISKIKPSIHGGDFIFNIIPPRKDYLYHDVLNEVKISCADTIFIELLTEKLFHETVYKPEKTLVLSLSVFKNGIMHEEIVYADFASDNKITYAVLPLFYHGVVNYNVGLAYFVGGKIVKIFEFYCIFKVVYSK